MNAAERPAQRIVENDPNELVARRLVLVLDDIVGQQHGRWVLVAVLVRRSARASMAVRGALKTGEVRGWFEIEAGGKRVRLLDLGRALIGGAQLHQHATRPPERSPHRRRGRGNRRRRAQSHPHARHF